MELTQEMKKDIELLTMVVIDDAAIAKTLQRKYGGKVSVIAVRKYRAAIAVDLPPAVEDEVEEADDGELVGQSRPQAPLRGHTSMEVGSNELLAAMCRWAFKHGKVLPNLTLVEQRERARADGYSEAIEGWA